MNKKEIAKAKKLLADHVNRYETAIYGPGQCLTVHWYGGGQRVFYSLAEVEACLDARRERYQSQRSLRAHVLWAQFSIHAPRTGCDKKKQKKKQKKEKK